jgi:hypothetical protein
MCWKWLFFAGILTISCGKKNNDLEVKITKQKFGYGYQILKNQQPVINQPNIPAIQGTKAFKNETDAHKAASLVVNKIRKYHLPKISIHELDSMKVEY